jgi:hypothetical protein
VRRNVDYCVEMVSMLVIPADCVTYLLAFLPFGSLGNAICVSIQMRDDVVESIERRKHGAGRSLLAPTLGSRRASKVEQYLPLLHACNHRCNAWSCIKGHVDRWKAANSSPAMTLAPPPRSIDLAVSKRMQRYICYQCDRPLTRLVASWLKYTGHPPHAGCGHCLELFAYCDLAEGPFKTWIRRTGCGENKNKYPDFRFAVLPVRSGYRSRIFSGAYIRSAARKSRDPQARFDATIGPWMPGRIARLDF